MLLSKIIPHRLIKLPSFRYFHFDNTKELALKMEDLINVGPTDKEKEEYKELLETKYNWDKVVEQVKEIYG